MLYDVIILGAGTAGLTAALYANRAGLNVLVVEKGIYGGQIVATPLIENYPAIGNISGFDFVKGLYEQAITHFNTKIIYGQITEFSLEQKIKTIVVSGQKYETKTIILATGAEHRKLGIPGEESFQGKGVSYCATCDGAFFRGKVTAVIGGGNTALQDAKYLANHCERVYLIHRRDRFRASKIEIESALARKNIQPVYDTVAEEILGDQIVTGLKIKQVKTGESSDLALDGVFIAVGLIPNNGNFSEVINMDEGGYIIAGEDCKTNLPGVFVAGDTRTKQVRQLVTAAADGAVSAEMAVEYLNQSF